jgi:protoporphyrinogen oxidase
MLKIAVIGAGPAGLTAAYELARRGHAVEVFEASPQVGGMARSFELWETRVDLGPHRFFSGDARVNALWHDLVGDEFQMVDRLTRIFHDGELFDYPLRPMNALVRLGVIESARCMLSYAGQTVTNFLQPTEKKSFEDWVVAAFGRRLFEVFFKEYSEKLWGITCDELDVDFAAQRIQRFSLGRAVLSALGLERVIHKTLVHRFPHPLQGAGVVYERMAARIREHGGVIHLNRPITGLGKDGRSLVQPDGTISTYDHIVSTMPLTALCRTLPDLPEGILRSLDRLAYRNTILIYLRVDHPDLFPDQWLYIQSPEVRLGRVTNFRNWPNGKSTPGGHSILALEYWDNDGGDLWKSPDDALIRLAGEEIRQVGLLHGAEIKDASVVRVPKCYPVYRKGYRVWLSEIVTHLRAHHPHLSLIGRYGAFKYNNQDHSILMGILAAENISGEAKHDLWEVNTDYQAYQEGSAAKPS